MLADLRTQLISFIEACLSEYPGIDKNVIIELDVPSDKSHGDFACNVALRLAKSFRKPPFDLAHDLIQVFQKKLAANPLQSKIAKIEVKKPGFINFFLTAEAFYDVLAQVFKESKDYGRLNFGAGKKIQIEFVSANPTGPLSVAHARQAAVGDALANILNFIGFEAVKEFYVNDEGNQINILGKSIQLRALEILGQKIEFLEDCYQGEYIKDMAQKFMDERHIKTAAQLEKEELPRFAQWGADYLLAVIKEELNDFGVKFDVWSHQSKIATNKEIERVLEFLKSKGFLYEKEGALWFRSTDFKDDKDRVVKKSDGAYTYLTPDIVYHQNKFKRGFNQVFNIWGPDHHGYIPRIKAAVAALGYDAQNLEVLIVQLATIYRDGQPISMSTRRGQYISLREVMEEVGTDAARFFFLMRHIEAHLEFDLELAKKQSPENPVYYIQYAHARIHSIIEKAKESNLKSRHSGWKLLKEDEELDLLKKIGQFSDMLLICHKQRDPFALVVYLQELATCFHKFYDKHRVVDEANPDLSTERLSLIEAAQITIANGLRLLGVATPNRM